METVCCKKKAAGPLPLPIPLPDDICLFWIFVFQRIYEVHFQNILEKIYISWSWSPYFLGELKNWSVNQTINNKKNNNTTPITFLIRNVMIFEPISFFFFFGSQEFLFESVPSPHFQNRRYGPAKKNSHLLTYLKCYAYL